MRKRIQHRFPKTGFALLQVLAWILAVVLPYVVQWSYLLAIGPLLFQVGVVVGIVGLVRCERNGQGLWRLLGYTAAILLSSMAFWFACLFVTAQTSRLSSHWDLILYFPLPFFSTGSFIYFGLGPFRSTVSPAQSVRQLIIGNRDLRIGGSALPEVVAKAERLLGLWLPTSFREFLLDFGEIRGTAVTFLGLGPTTDMDHPSKEDFVGATLDAREHLGLPQGYILCSVAGEGLLACLDTIAIEAGEGQVVLWNPATRSVLRVVARSFAEYLVHTLKPKARKR